MSTDKQVQANKQNAQLSTGPVTAEGKAKSSLNAVRTGLTGRTVLLPSDDVAAYQIHCNCARNKWNPEGEDEIELVQALADTDWRLARIPGLEMGIFALGRIEFAEKFAAIEDPSVVNELINAQVYIAYQKQLSNLTIQEARLRRQREKLIADLKQAQDERRRQAKRLFNRAVDACIDARREGVPFNPAEFGFEFSLDDIEARAAELLPRLFAKPSPDSARDPRKVA
jgi:hypothetical protein